MSIPIVPRGTWMHNLLPLGYKFGDIKEAYTRNGTVGTSVSLIIVFGRSCIHNLSLGYNFGDMEKVYTQNNTVST